MKTTDSKQNKQLTELSEDDLKQVTGGGSDDSGPSMRKKKYRNDPQDEIDGIFGSLDFMVEE